ncbi:MAG: hypothetical protein JRI68_27100 [Deltaproteobacteria bacterium]|nr:hypothetical protein [Deltaproteobacteria bacterium]
MHWGLGSVVCSAVLLGASAASADVVFHMDEPCPPGSKEVVDHCGPWCTVTACSSDKECTPIRDHTSGKQVQRSCRQAGLCVEDDQYESCSGWSHGEPRERKIARGPCTTDTDCKRPATCRIAKRCVAGAAPTSSSKPTASAPKPDGGSPGPDAPETFSPKRNCVCGWVGADRHGTTGWLPLAGLALALCGARRRHR